MALVKKVHPVWDGRDNRSTERSFEDLISLLASDSPDVRRRSVLDLAGCSEAVPSLLDLLAIEPDRVVRETILTAVAKMADVDIARRLAVNLRSENAGLRSAVAETLAALPCVAGVIGDLLADPDADVRILAVMILTLANDPSLSIWLASVVNTDDDARVVAGAIGALTDGQSTLELCVDTITTLMETAIRRFPQDPFIGFIVASHRKQA